MIIKEEIIKLLYNCAVKVIHNIINLEEINLYSNSKLNICKETGEIDLNICIDKEYLIIELLNNFGIESSEFFEKLQEYSKEEYINFRFDTSLFDIKSILTDLKPENKSVIMIAEEIHDEFKKYKNK